MPGVCPNSISDRAWRLPRAVCVSASPLHHSTHFRDPRTAASAGSRVGGLPAGGPLGRYGGSGHGAHADAGHEHNRHVLRLAVHQVRRMAIQLTDRCAFWQSVCACVRGGELRPVLPFVPEFAVAVHSFLARWSSGPKGFRAPAVKPRYGIQPPQRLAGRVRRESRRARPRRPGPYGAHVMEQETVWTRGGAAAPSSHLPACLGPWGVCEELAEVSNTGRNTVRTAKPNGGSAGCVAAGPGTKSSCYTTMRSTPARDRVPHVRHRDAVRHREAAQRFPPSMLPRALTRPSPLAPCPASPTSASSYFAASASVSYIASPDKGGLSTAAVIAIALCSMIATLLLLGAIYAIYRWHAYAVLVPKVRRHDRAPAAFPWLVHAR
jgi:hypothetical protein